MRLDCRRIKKILLTAVTAIVAFFYTPFLLAQAQQDASAELDKAQQWLAEGKYNKSFEEFQFYAQEKQNHLAQFTLALFHHQGWGIEKNMKKACQWFGKAATGGIPAANHFFALCLENGIHQQTNYAAALYWYQKAANLGHSLSLCSIAELYMQGKGVSKNPQKALHYCQQAAAAGSMPAQLKMGQFYLNGDDSIRDPQQAAIWFEYAAQKGSLEASYQLGTIYLNFLNNPSRALYWFETAASHGYLPAYFPTAQSYFNAPISDETRIPAAENLAKSYLWLSTTLQQSKNEHELKNAASMLKTVLQVMPESWKGDLDQKISQHLSRYHK